MAAACVSLVVPAWNAASTISACLRSIQRQTWEHWTCIVVDDGSTDATAGVVGSFAATDPRVVLVRRSHQGLVASLNEGLRHCHCPLIARMDADDVMHRQRLEAQVRVLSDHADLAAVGCHVRIFPRRGLSPRLREYEEWLNSLRSADDVDRDAFVECPVAHPTLMMRRQMADLTYQDRGWPEDYDLVLRALTSGLRIGMTPHRLLSWRDRPDGMSRTHAAYTRERFIACKAHYLSRGLLAETDRYVLWGYGATGRMLRAALAALGKTPSHIVEVKASRIGQRIHDAPVITIRDLASIRGIPIVVSVARRDPRTEIRAALAAMQFAEGQDYICAA